MPTSLHKPVSFLRKPRVVGTVTFGAGGSQAVGRRLGVGEAHSDISF